MSASDSAAGPAYLPRLLMTTVAWAVGSGTLLLVAALLAPRLAGGGSYTVVSGSMRGSVDVGDQVLVVPRPPTDIHAGDIVAFADPEGSGRLFQHRVQRIEGRGGEVEVVTMGDANTGYERWRAPAAGTIDQVVTVLPLAGYLVGPITRPIVRAAIAAISWSTLLVVVLLGLWRRPREPEIAR